MELDIKSSTSIALDLQNPATALTTTKTPEQGTSSVYGYRQNHVSSVMLAGVPIVSLYIDSKERLCLAQISNTLLKQFSYNEIHNRRVALGITCVQCTPVQLEILRRAGAMPISSRRCGMITKREAERLVKSFLEDNRPPKLPESFYFEVQHKCGWGCTGKFEPSRYNSSRAKCIKCSFCNLFFSPNKFIFHFHRGPDSKYNHPDAANFNSWRRHLYLSPDSDSEDIKNAWEDVKAMFNGGSRKRMVYSPVFSDSHTKSLSPDNKRQKTLVEENVVIKPKFGSQFQSYPMFSIPGKPYAYNALTKAAPLALQYQMGKNELSDQMRSSQILPFNPWRQQRDFMIPPYDILWASQFAARPDGLTHFRPNYFSTLPSKGLSSVNNRISPKELHNSSDESDSHSPFNRSAENLSPTIYRTSAFRPVLKSHGPDNNMNNQHDNELVKEVDDDLDIEISDECLEKIESIQENDGKSKNVSEIRLYSPDTSSSTNLAQEQEYAQGSDDHNIPTRNIEVQGNDDIINKAVETATQQKTKESIYDVINSHSSSQLTLENLSNVTKEDLQRLLRQEMDIRKQAEGHINKIKKSLHDQVINEKSKSYEIAKQLQAMKNSLCNELEQERKIRFSMQQKLKEAHDALHTFSCKMFRKGACDECIVQDLK